ncbi:MAG: nickel-dependent hydrogenase large subunit [Actinobacteria bacterium]|nr:nickel-dependent hydrogenase large subunit [Actinomycetota bacterium]
MVKKIVIHPITRIEGHLKVEAVVENGVVKDANMSGTMFRGIEMILKGRDPRDAVMITQRICGVCPEPHACAAVTAVDEYAGLTDKIPGNGILLRNLILGTRTVCDNILHFYILSGPDYIDPSKALDYSGSDEDLNSLKRFLEQGYSKPFLPRDEIDYRLDDNVTRTVTGHYIKALDIYRKGQEAATMFGGKWPHDAAIVAGGVTENVTADKIARFIWRLKEISDFVNNIYLPDVIAVARAYNEYLEMGRGCGNLLAYDSYRTGSNGIFKEALFRGGIVTGTSKYSDINIKNITEDVTHSWFKESEPLYPGSGVTEPEAGKPEAYSWIKSPRYDGKVFEVGPVASVLCTYLSKKDPDINKLVDNALAETGGSITNMYSIAGRHLGRVLFSKIITDNLNGWAGALKAGEPTTVGYSPPMDGEGVGLIAAPRGALGHWLKVKEGRIENYQVITPTAWNASPKDKDGQPGPYEQAIIGLKVSDSQAPVEILRAIRSFDPCTACAVHLVTPGGDLKGKYKVV